MDESSFELRYSIAFAVRYQCILKAQCIMMTVAKLVLFGKGSFMLHERSLKYVRSMVLSAMLTAISILLTRFVSPQFGDAVRFSFGTIPIMLAGIVCGPMYGFVVGIIADFLGFVVNPMGSGIIWGLTLCSGLLGAVPALIYNRLFNKRNACFLAVSTILSEVVVSGVLKSYFLMGLYGGTYLFWLVPKIVNALIMGVVEFVVLKATLDLLIKRKLKKD